jgi:hypothetical protein
LLRQPDVRPVFEVVVVPRQNSIRNNSTLFTMI